MDNKLIVVTLNSYKQKTINKMAYKENINFKTLVF